MLLEFVGMPGSGKSSLANFLVSSFPEDFKHYSFDEDKLVSLIIKKPVSSVTELIRIFQATRGEVFKAHQNLNTRQKLAPMITLLNRLLYFAEQSDNHNVILDEFVYQRALSFFGYRKKQVPDSVLHHYLATFSKYPTRRVYLVVDRETAKVRAINRFQGLPKRAQALDIDDFYEAQELLVQRLISLDSGAIVLDGKTSLEKLSDTLRKSIL